MTLLKAHIENLLKSRKWKAAVTSMAAVVVFITTYALILPALTLEEEVAESTPGIYLEEDDLLLEGEYSDDLYAAKEPEEDVLIQYEDGELYDSFSVDFSELIEEDVLIADEENISEDTEGSFADAPAIRGLRAQIGEDTIRFSFEETACILDGTYVIANEADETSDMYRAFLSAARRQLETEDSRQIVKAGKLYAITLAYRDGEDVVPADTVKVEISFSEALSADNLIVFPCDAEGALAGDFLSTNLNRLPDGRIAACSFDTDTITNFGLLFLDQLPEAERWGETETEEETEARSEAETEEETEEETEAWREAETEEETEVWSETETEEETEAWSEAETEEETEAWSEAETEEETGEETEIGTPVYSAASLRIDPDGVGYSLYIRYDETAQIPADAVFEAVMLKSGSEYDNYRERALALVADRSGETVESTLLGMFDLTIYDAEGNAIQPKAPVSVSVDFGEILNRYGETYAVHFPGSGKQSKAGQGAEAEQFPQTGQTAEKEHLLLAEQDAKDEQSEQAGEPMETVQSRSIRARQKKSVSKTGLSAAADVSLTEMGNAQNIEPELIITENAGGIASFEAAGFSVYAIVGAPNSLQTAADLSELNGNCFYLSIDNNDGTYYFKNTLNGNFISRTNMSDIDSAALYYFELIDDTENCYYIYTFDENNQKIYVNMTDDSVNFSFSDETRTPFVVEQHTDGKSFYIYYLRTNGNKCAWKYNSNGFIGAVENRNAGNRIVLTKVFQDDPYGLDGKSFGILNNQNTVSGTALMTGASNNNTRLSGKTMTVRTEPIKRTENVLVANNSDIAMWSFRSVSGDQYYITAEVNGVLKYLRIDDTSVTLVDGSALDDNCVITVEQGTGIYTGKYKFSCNGSALRLNGTTFDRVADLTTSKNGNCWMNLAELSNLKDDDFVVYTAEKVSVSGTVNEDGTIDYDVKDGDQIILYTRIWNEDTLRYDYYAVDYDGMLVKAYESGDTISWVGSKVNTMLWDFTEYHYLDASGNDTGVPNYYYELQNAYSGKYIAPQVSEIDFLSDSTIGINLNGRRNGEYYSTILAWDDPYYDYASLKVQDYQLTSAPITKADTFYFAVMKPDEQDQLTTVATIDSEPFGITLKMQNYANVGSNNRSQTQTDVLQELAYNQWGGVKNLLTKYIDSNGYPTSTKTGRSLADLYNEALTVNHQFLLSTYRETGYFEYDSTQNFAHLITSEADKWYGQESPSGGTYQIGDFVIYDQIASTTESTGDTRRHGQFFPYNDLTEGSFITNYVNDTDIHGSSLSSLNPRYGEKLYKLPFKNAANTDPQYVDFFFGMEMDASFMQSANGLDAWGHDLIFEFSGDDDFWLYIDDVLVLDLGGIHSALDGTVNFRTGTVVEQKGNGSYETTTLRARFKAAYLAQYPEKTAAEAEEWLDGIFKENENGVKTVFKDYSGHTMKMFYMERGAGASNLHMRFNLAPYTNGEVLLEKKVSGVENIDHDIVFPFQIRYHQKDWPEGRYELLGADNSVTDSQTGEAIPYREAYEVNGLTYQDVFLLKAGQTASVKFMDENVVYYVTECGMDTLVYDAVKANDDVLAGTDTEVSGVKDFSIEPAAAAARKKVIYDNHVNRNAQHNLTVTKKLWEDFAKTKLITDDLTQFRFRIYIGKNGDNYTVYNTGKYYVKNADGYYCVYRDGGFQSTGKTQISQFDATNGTATSKSDLEQITFYTSPSGIADRIPAGYSIEIPGLMDGTAFLVEEQDDEIPAGYNRIDYERVIYDDGNAETESAGYEDSGREDSGSEGEMANAGVIERKDAGIIVNNQHGYGLVAEKIWSDEDFMEDHDPIYFAVFRKENDNSLTLLTETVRQLSRTGRSVSWFFPELGEDRTLNDYMAYEVTLTSEAYTVNSSTGIVTLGEDCKVTRIEEGGILTVGGTTNEHGYSANYEYTASYSREELTREQIADRVNSRTDTVTNSRPGIKLVKTDLAGNPLEGAVFTLVKNSDTGTKKTFVSREDGLIAVAYLTADEEYTLTETIAPYKYLSLIDPITIKVDASGKLYVNGKQSAPEELYYTVTQVEHPTADNMPTVTIRNRAFTLQALKVDEANNEPIAGIQFALYREVMDYNHNVPMPYYEPMEDFEKLVTDASGVIPRIDLDHLQAGTYYLREERTTTQYISLDYDIRLTISQTGQIRVQKAVYSNAKRQWEFSDITDGRTVINTDENGNVTLYVKNTPAKGVQIIKKDYENRILADAEFALYKLSQISGNQPKAGEEALLKATTGEDGIINLGALDANTTYYLFETKAPAGYIQLTNPVVINTMSSGQVNAYLNDMPLTVRTIKGTAGSVDVMQITVYNSNGFELPSTGGPGTNFIYLLGTILAVLAGAGLVMRKRRRG